MSKIVLDNFGGIAPAINSRKLADRYAQIAENTYLKHGSLVAFPGTSNSAIVGMGSSVDWAQLYQGSFISQTGGTAHWAKVPIPNDTLDRIVFSTSTGSPKIKSGGSTFLLGIPSPAAPTITGVTAPSDPNGIDAETITYVATFVDAWGAEGPPSDPAVLTDRSIDTDVTVALPAGPTGNYNWNTGALIRLYRSNAGTSSTSYQFANEYVYTLAGSTVTDDTVNALLGEVIPTTDWIGPPDDNTTLYPNGPMLGICNLPNGVMAGYAGSTVVLSEPFTYHAWPAQYRITVPDTIIGVVPIAQGLVVATDRKPYLLTGVDPSAMNLMEIDVNQSCESGRSLVDMGPYAIYASPDGLVSVSGSSATLVTKNIFDRKQWQADWQPGGLIAAYWEGYYVAFNPSLSKGFMFSIEDGASDFVTLSQSFNCLFFDSTEDQLYVNSTGGTLSGVRIFGRNFSTPISSLTWQSKDFVLARPECMTVCRVNYEKDIATHPITVDVYGDGVLLTSTTIQTKENVYTKDQDWFRLPVTGKHRVYSVKIVTQNEVTRVVLATSMQELE